MDRLSVPGSTRQRLTLGALLALVAAAAVGLLLNRGGTEPPLAVTTTTSTSTTAAPTTTTTVPVVVAPLTGLPGISADRRTRPAVVVKLDNVEPKARPQWGLNEADVVYEERVEGSVTRLLAIFHSADAAPVGPVRSARTSDIALFSALHHPYFVWSGANPTFAARVRAAAMFDAGYDARSDAYFREGSRPAPDNLLLKGTGDLAAIPNPGSAPPPALFGYRAKGKPVAHLEAVGGAAVNFGSMAGAAPTEWRWNGSGWARTQNGTPHVDVAGVQVAPANVVIQFVTYAPTDVTDQFGVAIPEAQLVGEGEVWVLTGGNGSPAGLVQGRWQKPAVDAVTTYTDVDGKPILLTPGRTWVVLPSPGGASRL